MNKQQQAIENFGDMNCNQSVFTVFGPDYGLSKESCFKIGLVYGGGMAHQGKTCGAVTGAYNVIGLWAATQSNTGSEQKAIARQKAQEFNQLFVKAKGSLECKILLTYDISKPEEAEQASELNLFETICPKFVGESAAILEQILK